MSDFERFWAASRHSPLTLRRLAETLTEPPPPTGPDPFTLPGRPYPLTTPADPLQRLFAARRSGRAFGPGPLPAADLGAVLAALAATPDGRRGYPSAGGLGAVRGYPLLLDVEHELTGRVTRHDPVAHALQDVGPCPRWPELRPLLGTPDDAPAPALVLALVLTDGAMLDKYGARGGRFGLIEVGAAAQAVSLRVAEAGLAGHLLGAGADREVLALAGLTADEARLGVIVAIGSRSLAPSGNS